MQLNILGGLMLKKIIINRFQDRSKNRRTQSCVPSKCFNKRPAAIWKKCLLFIFLLLISVELDAASYEIIPEKNKLPILTPTFKDRKTAKIRLENGLEAYLISDPNLNFSGAMMSVDVGSWEDPEEYPGIAHFLEHMLFMGTKEYPREGEYSSFITDHGGQANAFTSSSTTNYLFTVQNDAFKGAFERFSSFFKNPLFNPSGVSRELKAIDQEYAKNIENDSIRFFYVLKDISNPDHPFHNFNMGNSSTLSQVSQNTLKQWYQKHYSANLMKLVVYSSLPLDQLKIFVANQLKDIPNHDREAFVYTKPAFSQDLEGKIIYIDPIKNEQKLTILWELPSKFAHMIDSKPDELIAFVLGHEGEHSLLAQLKKEELADSLSCGGLKLGSDLCTFFIEIDLTKAGLMDVDQVITRVFQTVGFLKKSGIPQYIFNEVQTIQRLQYQYQSKENEFYALMKHAYNIQDEKMESYPEKTNVIQKFDPESIHEMLSYMTPQRALLFVTAPEKMTGVKPETREKWLGVDYKIESVSSEIAAKWNRLDPHLDILLPKQNPFIPTDLKVINSGNFQKNYYIPNPQLLINDSFSKFYYAKDNYFGLPKVSWVIQIKTPKVSTEHPQDVVFTEIYIKLVKSALDKLSYPAKMAGLDYDIQRKHNGIEITLEGYSENAEKLYEKIIQKMVHLKLSESKFKIVKNSLDRKYLNFSKASPLKQSIELFRSLLYEHYVTEWQKASAIRKADFKKFREWLSQLYHFTYTEGVLYGNLKEKDARKIVNLTRDTFYNGIYPKPDQLKKEVIVIPQNEGPYYVESRTKSMGNAVLLAVETPILHLKKERVQQILMQAIKQPFFNALRTKQQTGYLVDSQGQEIEHKLFNLFAVQSDTHGTMDLLYRFEAFIEGYLQELGKKTG